MTFMPLEAEEKSRHRELRWVSLEGKQSLKKMTSEDTCLTHVHGIVTRETPNVRDLSFRDQSGQLRTRIRVWENIWTVTNRQRMSLNGWSMGWMSKNSLNPRLEFLRTTILANSSRSVFQKQFCNLSSQERSVFGVKGVKWHRPTSAFP